MTENDNTVQNENTTEDAPKAPAQPTQEEVNLAIAEILKQRDDSSREAQALRVILKEHNIPVGELRNAQDILDNGYTPPTIQAPAGQPRTVQGTPSMTIDQFTSMDQDTLASDENWAKLKKFLES